MTNLSKFQELKTLINDLEVDANKFFTKGNSVAGVRVRKTLQDVKTIAQELRIDIQGIKNKK